MPDGLRDAIRTLCTEGDAFAAGGYHDEAIADYRRAWMLIPPPQTLWCESIWVLGALADACFLSNRRVEARQALEYAMRCPGGRKEFFLSLRLGQILLDDGKIERGVEMLMNAYRGAGSDIFASEDERYLAFLKRRGLID